ncbi:hypothetical protein NKH77_09335 [Streptomyces sp. M19]
MLDLRDARRPELTFRGPSGDWTHRLSPRHAEVLLVLAAHPEGVRRRGSPRTCSATRAVRSPCAPRCPGCAAPWGGPRPPPVPCRRADPGRDPAAGAPADLLPDSVAPAVVRLRSAPA